MLHRFFFTMTLAASLSLVCFECAFLVYLVRSLIRHRRVPKLFFRRPVMLIHALIVAFIACFGYAWFIEPYRLEVTYHVIPSDKWFGPPLRIIQFSDTHCDYRPRLEEQLVRTVNSLKPDLVVFTGDAVNPPHSPQLFQRTLAAMQAPLGKYAIRGNWDINSPHLFENTGFTELDGETVPISKGGATLRLTGLAFNNTGRIWRYLHAIAPEDFSLFLYHSPDLVDYLEDLPVDLYLCGHTHGGQVRLPGYGALVTFSRHGKKYESGQYRVGHFTLYVNRGLGMEGHYAPRIRFLCRPELAVFDIVPEKHDE